MAAPLFFFITSIYTYFYEENMIIMQIFVKYL